MSGEKTVIPRIMKPRLPLTIALTLVCVPALSYIFAHRLDETAAAYPVYLASAYTLCAWCVRVPVVVIWLRDAVHRHPFGSRYMTDITFRARLSLYASTGVNLCYALLKLGAGIYYRSFWFGAIAVYYLVLTAARALLLKSVRSRETELLREYKTARLCGVLLFVLNIALSAVTVQMVTGGKGYEYPGYLIFVMAGYAFCSVGVSVANLVRFRRLNSPVLSASKTLGLATALVSMLSLQTAMFASFGGDYAFRRLMNALTGGAVCLTIFLMAVWLVVRSGRWIQKFKMIGKEGA